MGCFNSHAIAPENSVVGSKNNRSSSEMGRAGEGSEGAKEQTRRGGLEIPTGLSSSFSLISSQQPTCEGVWSHPLPDFSLFLALFI